MPLSSSSVSQALLRSTYYILTTTVVNILLHIYAVHAFPDSATTANNSTHAEDGFMPKLRREDSSSSYTVVNDGFPNGGAVNGHPRSRAEAQQIQDAEAFELQGLISEDEHDEHENSSSSRRRKEVSDEEEENLVSPR